MTRSRYKIYEEEYPYFITSSIHCGLPLFGIPWITRVVYGAMQFLRNQREVKIIAYVIMEDHLHLIVQGRDLSTKAGHFKSYIARETIDGLKKA